MARVLLQCFSLSSFSLPLFLLFLFSINNIVVQGKIIRTALFIFGDSYYDTGNSKFLPTATMGANFPPYGNTYFKKPTGRYCDGRLIPDFIAKYANMSSPPQPYLQQGSVSYKKGVDFACSGAGALNDTLKGNTVSLKTQVDYYKKVVVNLRQQFGHGESKAILSKAVFLFNIGQNDYLFPLVSNSTALMNPHYVGQVVGNISVAIKEVYRLGGRKFAINNVGPLGCLPIVKAGMALANGTCIQQVSQIAILHNQLLSQALVGLGTQYKDFKYGLFEMYNNLKKRVTNPIAYGMKEGGTACCGSGPFRGKFNCGRKEKVAKYELCHNPKEYIFWDAVHPSDMTYKELASLIWAGSPIDIGPYNVKTLFHLPY